MSDKDNGKDRRTEVIKFLEGKTVHGFEYLGLLIESDMRYMPTPRAITWETQARTPRTKDTKVGPAERADGIQAPAGTTATATRDPRLARHQTTPKHPGHPKQPERPGTTQDSKNNIERQVPQVTALEGNPANHSRDPRLRKKLRAHPQISATGRTDENRAASLARQTATMEEEDKDYPDTKPIRARKEGDWYTIYENPNTGGRERDRSPIPPLERL